MKKRAPALRVLGAPSLRSGAVAACGRTFF